MAGSEAGMELMEEETVREAMRVGAPMRAEVKVEVAMERRRVK